jgi:hypothetical protein
VQGYSGFRPAKNRAKLVMSETEGPKPNNLPKQRSSASGKALAHLSLRKQHHGDGVTDAKQPNNPIIANRAFLDLTGYGREVVLGQCFPSQQQLCGGGSARRAKCAFHLLDSL